MKFLISTILIFFFIVSCQKEFGDNLQTTGVATFSLANPSGNCTAAIVNGTYTAGALLTANNTVAIKVMVTSVGSYSLSSSAVNGISFSASGNFTSTGEQTINLVGSGIPLADGNFTFTFGNNGCSFSITTAPGVKNSAVYTYDGAPYSCTNISKQGEYTVGVPLTSSHKVKIDVNVTIPGTYFITTPLVNGISFSGSGNLETMGFGVVTLQGAGTPINNGTFAFTPSNNGCPFAIFVHQ
jgi:hypothetical protein